GILACRQTRMSAPRNCSTTRDDNIVQQKSPQGAATLRAVNCSAAPAGGCEQHDINQHDALADEIQCDNLSPRDGCRMSARWLKRATRGRVAFSAAKTPPGLDASSCGVFPFQ